MAFGQVTSGNPTLAIDINQLLAWVLGASNQQALITNGTATPFIAQFSSAPGSDTALFQGQVSGDTVARTAEQVNGSDGYGQFAAGAGSSFTAHWHAQSTGWKTPESVTIVGGLTVQGATSVAGLNTSGNASVGGTLNVTGTSSLDGGGLTTNGAGSLTIASGQTLNMGPGFTTIHGNGFGAPQKKIGISGTATVTHSLGYTPNLVEGEQNSSGSQTTGHDTIGSTTYHFTCGNGANADTYCG